MHLSVKPVWAELISRQVLVFAKTSSRRIFLKVQQKVDYEDRLEVAVVVVSFCCSCRLRCCSDLNEAFVMFLVQRICKIRLQSFSGFGGKWKKSIRKCLRWIAIQSSHRRDPQSESDYPADPVDPAQTDPDRTHRHKTTWKNSDLEKFRFRRLIRNLSDLPKRSSTFVQK